MDAVNSKSRGDGDFDDFDMVCRQKNGAVADDIISCGVYIDDKSDVYNKFRVAFIVRIVYGDYDIRA